MNSRRGFTLIELLLAAAGGALILGVLVNVFSGAIHARNHVQELIRASRLQERAVEILRKDLRGARLSGGSMAKVIDASTAAVHSNFAGDFRFTTTSARIDEDHLNGDLQVVEYYISLDPDATDSRSGRLVRSVTRNPLTVVEETIVEEPILSGVTAMEVAFFDGNDWLETWTYDETNPAVPSGVRIRLQLAQAEGAAGAPRVLEVTVPWLTQIATPPASTTTDTTGGTAP